MFYYSNSYSIAAIAQVVKHNQAKFRALANMGEVLIKMNNLEEAIKVYQKQLALSKQQQDKVV
jgi:tetratricopeptide (TPR) repeat protein